ncbi:MAG TPA: hypothetical protein VK666_29840 [Chryseolinea sp.]|nr:hypothetical protein [Chryseolinea sp.]
MDYLAPVALNSDGWMKKGNTRLGIYMILQSEKVTVKMEEMLGKGAFSY